MNTITKKLTKEQKQASSIYYKFNKVELPTFQGIISHTENGIIDTYEIRGLWTYKKGKAMSIGRTLVKMIKYEVFEKLGEYKYKVNLDLATEIIKLKFAHNL